MISDEQPYDLIIIGTGAGGGTLAYKLAATGKKILILEQGTYLPKEKQIGVRLRFMSKSVTTLMITGMTTLANLFGLK